MLFMRKRVFCKLIIPAQILAHSSEYWIRRVRSSPQKGLDKKFCVCLRGIIDKIYDDIDRFIFVERCRDERLGMYTVC